MLKESGHGSAKTEPQIVLSNTLASSTGNASVSEATTMDISTKSVGSVGSGGNIGSVGSVGSVGSLGNVGIVRGVNTSTVRAVRPGRNIKVVTLSKSQPLKKVIHPSDLQVLQYFLFVCALKWLLTKFQIITGNTIDINLEIM